MTRMYCSFDGSCLLYNILVVYILIMYVLHVPFIELSSLA